VASLRRQRDTEHVRHHSGRRANSPTGGGQLWHRGTTIPASLSACLNRFRWVGLSPTSVFAHLQNRLKESGSLDAHNRAVHFN
jgi:hypothetical protein